MNSEASVRLCVLHPSDVLRRAPISTFARADCCVQRHAASDGKRDAHTGLLGWCGFDAALTDVDETAVEDSATNDAGQAWRVFLVLTGTPHLFWNWCASDYSPEWCGVTDAA